MIISKLVTHYGMNADFSYNLDLDNHQRVISLLKLENLELRLALSTLLIR
jgi:hypothetical protein